VPDKYKVGNLVVLMALAFLVIITFYGATNYYIGNKMFVWLQLMLPNTNWLLFWGIYVFCAITPVLAGMLANFRVTGPISAITGFIGRLGDQWMGIYCYLLLITITIDLILLIGRLFKIVSVPINGNVHFLSGLIIVLAVLGLCSYGNYHANQIKSVSYDIQIPKKMLNDNVKIVMLSDLHLGYTNDVAYLKKVVDKINDMEPDIVCMVGDIFNGSYYALADAEKAEELMRGIQSTYGVYASLGNHDAGTTFNEMVAFFNKSDITLLNDENTIIGEQIVLVGRKDSSPIGGQGEERTSISEQLEKIQPDLPIIVMDHQPSNISEYDNQVDLILSGHTHKGQIFPGSLITNAIYEVDYGYYQKDEHSPKVIVSSGIGTWGPPMRIGTDSEIVEILLNPLNSTVD
jgi:hypothetical protein